MTRVLVFSLLGFILVTLMGSLQNMVHMEMVVVDVPLIVVLYMAMTGRRTIGGLRPAFSGWSSGIGIDWSGGITGVILGYISDIMGGGVKGLHCFTLAVMFLLCWRAARHVYLTGPLSAIVVSFFASVVASMMGLIVRWLALGVPPSMGSLSVLLAQGVLCAVAAVPLLKLLRFIDIKLAQVPGSL